MRSSKRYRNHKKDPNRNSGAKQYNDCTENFNRELQWLIQSS